MALFRLLAALMFFTPKLCAAQEPPEAVYAVRFDAVISEPARQRVDTIIEDAQKAQAKGILLVINSPGGSVDAGMALSRSIESSPLPVYCLIDGEADSMAFYVLQSCDGRFMLRRSRLMAHEPITGGATPPGLNEHDMRRIADYFRSLHQALAEHEAARMNISVDEFMKRTSDKEWWMNWREALNVGAVDETFRTVAEATSALRERLSK